MRSFYSACSRSEGLNRRIQISPSHLFRIFGQLAALWQRCDLDNRLEWTNCAPLDQPAHPSERTGRTLLSQHTGAPKAWESARQVREALPIGRSAPSALRAQLVPTRPQIDRRKRLFWTISPIVRLGNSRIPRTGQTADKNALPTCRTSCSFK